nr:LemA family protein [Schlegelella koreensis]
MPTLDAQLGQADTAFAFARSEFNAAVAAYNVAVAEQPTIWLARLVGFRPAGLL